MASTFADDRIKKGETVLVTGVTGLIGSAIANDLASRGLKTKGTVRDRAKAQPLADKIDKLYGPGLIELVEIADATAPGAYDDAVQGVSGVIHLAIDLAIAFTSDSEGSIKSAVDMTVGIAKSAAKSPSVKSVVICSSVVAHYNPVYGQDIDGDIEQWNEQAIKLAKEMPDDNPMKGMFVYSASKARAEQEFWGWVQAEKPSFVANSVAPAAVLGPVFNPAPGGYSTYGYLNQDFQSNGQNPFVKMIFSPAAWAIDVRDVATIHVAAALDPETADTKLYGAAYEPMKRNTLYQIWSEAFPDKKFEQDPEEKEPPKQALDLKKEERLIKKYAGRDYLPLKQSLIDTVGGQ